MSLFEKKNKEDDFQKGRRTEVEERLIDALKILRDAGVVDEEEYREKKRKILDIN